MQIPRVARQLHSKSQVPRVPGDLTQPNVLTVWRLVELPFRFARTVGTRIPYGLWDIKSTVNYI